MRRSGFWIPAIMCGLLLSGCAAGGTKGATSGEKKEETVEDKSKMKTVEEIMRASADGTKQILEEMFSR